MNQITFEELNLSSETLDALNDMGFANPSPIQAEAIPQLLNGLDIIGQAQTGTGKTAAFAIPLVEQIDASDKNVQALVLCPTRELAMQVNTEIGKILKYRSKIHTLAIYGGDPIDKQIKALKRGVQIIVGTPGRVIDHLNRGTLKIENLKTIVLDEADEMLNMGFREEIQNVLDFAPTERQTVLFSATMPKPIMELTKKYQKNPTLIKVTKKELTVENIEQVYYEVNNSDKINLLQIIVEQFNLRLMLVFTNTKRMADELAEKLQAVGLPAEALHGDLTQAQRSRVMSKFRKTSASILVATDVAARGIDVTGVDAVVNYDIPQDIEQYVHRIGRTGRAGQKGMAFTFVNPKERRRIKEIENHTKAKIAQKSLPSKNELLLGHYNKLLTEVREIIEAKDSASYGNILESLQKEGYSYEEIAAALAKKVMSETEERIKNLSVEKPKVSSKAYSDDDTTRLFINVGKKSKVSPGDILGAITGETGIAGKKIGEIDIFDKFTFVDVPTNEAQKIIKKLTNAKIKGNKVNVEIAAKPAYSRG